MRLRSLGLTLIGITLIGCASNKYSWGDYEDSLYGYYKNPAKAEALVLTLEKTIQTAERTQKPIPPGLYAEYGYLLFQQGKAKEALPFFEKEKAKWPESTTLMNSMIQMASNQSKNG